MNVWLIHSGGKVKGPFCLLKFGDRIFFVITRRRSIVQTFDVAGNRVGIYSPLVTFTRKIFTFISAYPSRSAVNLAHMPALSMQN